jgi:hypothetical protein
VKDYDHLSILFDRRQKVRTSKMVLDIATCEKVARMKDFRQFHFMNSGVINKNSCTTCHNDRGLGRPRHWHYARFQKDYACGGSCCKFGKAIAILPRTNAIKFSGELNALAATPHAALKSLYRVRDDVMIKPSNKLVTILGWFNVIELSSELNSLYTAPNE